MDRGNNWRKRRFNDTNKAVSPIIGTILMVSITVVLAGVLVVYLNSMPTESGNVQPPMGAIIEKTYEGNWTLQVIKGSTDNVEVSLRVINPATGTNTLSELIDAPSYHFRYNNNNANGKFDTGDTILLNQTAGIIEKGHLVQVVKGGNIIIGPYKIP